MSKQKPDNLKEIAQISVRIKELIEHFGDSVAGFSSRIGVEYGALQPIVGPRGTKANAEVIQAIARFAGVNSNWLLTGEEPMFRGGTSGGSKEDVIELKQLAVKVSAGDGALVFVKEEIGKFRIGEAYFRKVVGIDPDSTVMVSVEGDSMVPTLAPNDLVMVNLTKPNKIVDGLWVVRLGLSALVKRIQVLPKNILRVTSDNPAYKEFEMDMNEEQPDFELVGRVVWAPRLF